MVCGLWFVCVCVCACVPVWAPAISGIPDLGVVWGTSTCNCSWCAITTLRVQVLFNAGRLLRNGDKGLAGAQLSEGFVRCRLGIRRTGHSPNLANE
ncbi:hypothetical protein F5Y08DRAFT_308490 [Xylaria arbuscula]|nr:hypothetical protein F5Y08DRAFT_308490 [Xylaria arbuscula]